jgi:hypothetical protein
MRTTLAIALIIAGSLQPLSARAWGGSGSSPSYAAQQQGRQDLLRRDATWRQRFKQRILKLWNKRPFQHRSQPRSIDRDARSFRPRVGVFGWTRSHRSPRARPVLHVRTRGEGRWATITGGFGSSVRRAVRKTRVKWHRFWGKRSLGKMLRRKWRGGKSLAAAKATSAATSAREVSRLRPQRISKARISHAKRRHSRMTRRASVSRRLFKRAKWFRHRARGFRRSSR